MSLGVFLQLVFFEAVWLFWSVDGANKVSLKQRRLPVGRQDWEVHSTMVADFTQSGRACSGIFRLWALGGGWWCWAPLPQGCTTPLSAGAAI